MRPKKKLLALLLLPLLSNCAIPPKFPRHVLLEQILTVRENHPGLTNLACEEWDKKNACTKFVIVDYRLDDQTFRTTINQLGFSCSVGGRLFKVCTDKPGFCRITYKKKCTALIFCKQERQEEYIPIDPVKFHLDAGTTCFSDDQYPMMEFL